MDRITLENILASGRAPVGYICTSTPSEIIHAAGGRPFRLTGTGENLEEAESLVHPNLCGYCKSILAWIKSQPSGMNLKAVVASSCDGCSRLAAILEKLPMVSGVAPLDLPKTRTPEDIAYFADALKQLYARLSQALGSTGTVIPLAQSIQEYNRCRRAFREILNMTYEGRLPIRAAFDIAQAYFLSTPEEFSEHIKNTKESALDVAPEINKPKVIIAGNVTLDHALAEAVEEAGAKIVGLDLCNVERAATLDVNEELEPFTALANAVMSRHTCPRFEPQSEWIEQIIDRADKTGAKGIILFSQKFCDNTLYVFPEGRKLIEDAGLAVLTLEGEFTQGVSGQIATRIEAFIEML